MDKGKEEKLNRHQMSKNHQAQMMNNMHWNCKSYSLKKIEETKSKAKKATDVLLELKKKPDMISHSSFHVGDIGLLMPTGHG
eukprot:15142743-Ditylum_brightwellii.AAC.1